MTAQDRHDAAAPGAGSAAGAGCGLVWVVVTEPPQ